MNPLLSLLKSDRPDKPDKNDSREKPVPVPTPPSTKPHLDSINPPRAMPGGEVEVKGINLGPNPHIPLATIGDIATPVLLTRPTRITLKIPEGSISDAVFCQNTDRISNPRYLRVAVPL